jgi:hypothetical protein
MPGFEVASETLGARTATVDGGVGRRELRLALEVRERATCEQYGDEQYAGSTGTAILRSWSITL